MTLRRLRHRRDHVVGEVARVRRGEAHPLQAVDLPAGPQQFAERLAVAEAGPVGVDVLAKQGHLEHAVLDQRPDLGEHVAGAAVLLPAAQARHDAEGAGVVAADRDGDPRRVRGLAARRQHRGEPLQRLHDLDLRLGLDPGALQQRRAASRCCACRTPRPPTAPARAIPARSFCARQPPTAICMPGCDDLHRQQLAEVPVQPVVGVLPHRTGVEDDHVRHRAAVGALVARLLEQARKALGVVEVHLAPVGADLVSADGVHVNKRGYAHRLGISGISRGQARSWWTILP